MANFRVLSLAGQTLKLVSPLDYRRTAKITWSFQDKQQHGVSGKTVHNSKWSLTDNAIFLAPVQAGCSPCDVGRENAKIFTEISCSVENKVELVKMLRNHSANLLVLAETLSAGFPPDNTLALPVATE